MRKEAAALWAMAVLLASFLSAAASARLAGPRLGPALLSFVSAHRGLCLARADGSRRVRLTPRWRWVGRPSWSPRGRYLAFDHYVGTVPGSNADTVIVVADTSGRVRASFGSGNHNLEPAWSPDGRRIAFVESAHGGVIVTTRPDGSDERTVFLGTTYSAPGDPSWTPDGQHIAFDYYKDAQTSIYSVRVDGRDLRLLAANAVEPAFSPDGSRLAYVALANGLPAAILIANADGSNPRGLTGSSAGVSPAWSPGGKLIAYSSGRSVVVANADGSGNRAVVTAAYAPAWRPAVALPAAKRRRCR